MKKILLLIISLSLTLTLSSCISKKSNKFISDYYLKYYGVEEIKNLISSEVYYTIEYGTRINSYLYYNNDLEVQILIENVYEMIMTDKSFSYCGYIPHTQGMSTRPNVFESSMLEEHYINKNDMCEDSMTLTSCVFVYKKINDENVYELEITSYPEMKIFNDKEFNLVIKLDKKTTYTCNYEEGLE